MSSTDKISVLGLSLNLLLIPCSIYHRVLLIQKIFIDLMNKAMYSVGQLIALQIAIAFFSFFLKKNMLTSGNFPSIKEKA